jgi:DNA invertase Pin-like site-specific DNA recombinase
MQTAATSTVTEKPGTDYYYIRVSTHGQKEDRQVAAMRDLNIPRRNIFVDKQSGKDFQREAFQRLLKKLRPGDCLYVKELDRFGRNYDEIHENWRLITREIGADIVVLECPFLDTRPKSDDLVGRFLRDTILGLLSYLAETELKKNHQRQAEGIAAAKEKGIQLGRHAKEKPENFAEVAEHWQNGDISARFAAKELGVAFATFKLWVGQSPAGCTFATASALPHA